MYFATKPAWLAASSLSSVFSSISWKTELIARLSALTASEAFRHFFEDSEKQELKQVLLF